MSYREFSTEKADYVLQLGNHILKNKDNIFHDLDSLVLETGTEDPGNYTFSGEWFGLENDCHMGPGVKYAKERMIPIFLTDNPRTPNID